MKFFFILILTILMFKNVTSWVFVDLSYYKGGFMDVIQNKRFENTESKQAHYTMAELRDLFDMTHMIDPKEILDGNDRLIDLDTKKEHANGTCYCPRVYVPVCASNGVSYSNVCVMYCTRRKLSVRREGPCIEYRRRNNGIAYNITIPENWIQPNITSDKLIELTLLNIDYKDAEGSKANATIRQMRRSQALLDFLNKVLPSNENEIINVMISRAK